MTKGHPQLENLRQLRHALNKLRRIQLSVGEDGRNRTVLWPFKSKTGRTQPKAREWIFSPAVWLRRLIRPDPGMAVAYVDWSSMEFFIAAALSGDPVMREFYRGDPYLAFPKRVGLAPRTPPRRPTAHCATATRSGCCHPVRHAAHQPGRPAQHLRFRRARDAGAAPRNLLGILGMGPRLARARARHRQHADGVRLELCHRHHGIQRALNHQLAGAGDRRRHSAVGVVWATRHGLRLLAPVHDAIVIEAPLDRIEHDVALLREIMRPRLTCRPQRHGAGDLELRTDASSSAIPIATKISAARRFGQVLELLAEGERSSQHAEAAHG